jgi:tetratricopeptide (TPR) repeat protein
VRVNVQLINAEADEHVWAERFDKERRDVLQAQDEIVGRLTRSLGIEMIRNEAVRGSLTCADKPDAADLVMRGRALGTDKWQRENAAEAVSLFRRALQLDPDNVDAMVGIASTHTYQVVNLRRIDERDKLLEEADALISRAIALAPDHIGVLKARAVLLRARGRFLEAMIATDAVIARNPGEPTAYREIGLNKLYLGATREAADWFRRADRIAPRDRVRWTWLQGLGRALMQLGQDAEAVDVLTLSLDGNSQPPRGLAFLAAAEALAGDIERARLHMAEFVAREPGITVCRFTEECCLISISAVNPVYLRRNERILDGMRRAGMLDEW